MAELVGRAALLAGLALVGSAGLVLIYGFGAGYYGAVHVPSPWNIVLSILFVVGLVVVLVRGVRKVRDL